MTSPHAGHPSFYPRAAPTQRSENARRPSYATVAAGRDSASRESNTTRATALPTPSMNPTSAAPPRPQASRDASRYSTRAMDVDGQAPGGSRRRESATNARWSGELRRHEGGMACSIHNEHAPFFTPSYLRHSRHVRWLRQSYEEHLAELQEKAELNPPKPPALSASSSNVNLSKMQAPHFHRGVVQDVIERVPPPTEEDGSHPLPSRWSDDDRMGGLEILAEGSEVRFNGITKTSDEALSIRSDHPMPKECGLYYFEVTVLSRGKDGLIGIGFSGRKASLNRLPGWEQESWAYHGDDGFSFANTPSGKAYGPRFAAQDVIGCGVNFRTSSAFFTKNGVHLGVAFTDIKSDRLYPSVGMKKPGEHLRVNFGKHPFVFDIDSLMEKERQSVLIEIRAVDVTSLHPPDTENVLIHKLIDQYLAHEGYVETSKAFSKDVHDQEQPFSEGSQHPQISDADDDIHAIHRQKIRKSILSGSIDKALKYTHSYYPLVLQDERNRDIYFRLRCRKFTEMMRRYTELQNATSSPAMTRSIDSLGSNGYAESVTDKAAAIQPADTQMELDDQIHSEASRSLEEPSGDVDMDASQELPPKKSTLMKQNDLLTSAINYGRELQAEFGSDPRPQTKKQLSDIFAIMAYTDPRASVVGGLLDPKGRMQIAEEVNGAILVSLGKPSSAALELLCAQTEAFLEAAAGKTAGAAALINVRDDFLQG